MSFFDEFKEIGGNFVKAAEKEVLIEHGIPFVATGVVSDDENKFGPRFVLQILLTNPESGEDEARVISFGKSAVESRDRMLAQMGAYLEREDAAPVRLKLTRNGRSLILVNADAA